MRDFLKRYKIQMEILTPVFIGAGSELTKKEYIYDKENKYVWIPDKQHLIRDIYKRKLENKFEEYMLSQNEPLLNWMESVGYKEKEIQKLCSYSMDCSQALENLNHPIAIQEFVKDAYGMPYIPGSSLKGAIRTALLGTKILDNPRQYQSLKKEVIDCNPVMENGKPNKKYLVLQGKKAEVVAFHTIRATDKKEDAKNDELKGIHISDSKPLKLQDLILCQKIDLSMEQHKNALNILRESLRPKTVVEFELTIDTSVSKLKKEDIERALQNTWNFYRNAYVKKFMPISEKDKGNLYLGGGCGFGTKTVIYELLEERQRVRIVSQLMDIKFKKHRQDVRKGVSPRRLKCTNYKGAICEMGKCFVKIEEI